MIITPRRFRVASLAYALASVGLITITPIHAAPQGGSVVAGSANISSQGSATTIVQTSDRAVINWRDFSSGSTESIRFFQPSASSATLNRVTGQQMSVLKGRLDANGQVILINPNGIVIGQGAQINVGSLIASTSALGNDDFMAGRLTFTPSGIAGQGIRNDGTITAAEGGLVALVAPHVRNDGVIEARLGRVQIGAADRFTIDLYGDGLINLALDESNRGALRDADGAAVDQLISMNGAINTAGGQTVLIAAADAGAVLDRAINLQGTVRAEFASEQAGRIVLSGGSGSVEVGGRLLATGPRGGQIDVTGDQVRVVAGALIDAHGGDAGGRVRIGGDWQGQGTMQRSSVTEIATGSWIDVHASGLGDGGQAVVWSDGHTSFAGAIDARGGAAGGNGGQVEVSGRHTLDFAGSVDAGAANGVGGSLLLDPEIMNIGLAEAGLINRVLRTGTSTTVSADLDINLNSLIDGRGRASGGGLTLAAGRDINLNDYLVTQNGAVNLIATTGTVNFAAGKAVFTGSGAINVSAGGNLALGSLFTTGRLDARSIGGTLTVGQGIDALTGPVALRAAQDLTVAQPIANFANGSALTLTSDSGNIVVNAPIDGRGGVSGGGLTLTAGNDIYLNDYIVTQNGAVNLVATTGGVNFAAGKAVITGNGAINVSAGGNLALGSLFTTGSLDARSIGGTLTVTEGIDALTGPVVLRAAQDLTVAQPIVNFANGSALTLTSDSGNIVINAQLDGRAANGVASGPVSLVAANNILINQSIVSEDSPLSLSATGGTVTQAAGQGLFAGSGAISVSAGGALTTGLYGTTGALNLRSIGGALTVGEGIDALTGPVALRSALDLTVNQPIVNFANGSALTLTSDSGNIVINAQLDGRAANGVASGPLSLVAGNNILLNQSIVSEDSPLSLSATSGTVTAAAGQGLFAGSGAISVSTGGDLSTGIYGTTGALDLRSTGGTLTVATQLDETLGNITLQGGTGVDINQGIANIRNGSSLTVIADAGNINVNARIDAQDDADPSSITPVAGGAVTLTAANNVNFNETLVTFNGAVNVTATSGTVSFSNAGTNGSGNKKILTGNAPITVTSGGDFTTGTAPPSGLTFDSPGAVAPDIDVFFADSLKPWVTMATTGKLTLVSTGGNVSIDAPIPQTTGEIEIRAGNDVIVNEKLINVGLANTPISITAGTACTIATCPVATNGRIIVNDPITDGAGGVDLTYNGGTPIGFGSVNERAPVDSRFGNLTMTAFGNVLINDEVASGAILSITSTQGTLFGEIGDSLVGRPQQLILSGAAGIGALGNSFGAGQAGTITATSANGPIYLYVNGTNQLTVTAPSVTAGDIVLSNGFAGMGANVSLAAGRDIDLRNSSLVGNLTMNAGRDILVETMTAGSINVTGAGQDVLFDATGMGNNASLWLTGPMTVSNVGRDIRFLNESGLSLMDADDDPTTGAQPALTLAAARNVELRRLQTYGAVNISAGDDILLVNDIGPVITSPLKFTVDKGVAALTLTTGTALGDSITMQGARAVGNVNITTDTLTAAKSITSTSGSVLITAATQNLTAGAIGNMDEMHLLPIVAPAIPPGPAVNPPVAPAALNALAPAAPGGVAVGLAVTPAGVAVGAAVAPAGVAIDQFFAPAGGDDLVLASPDKNIPAEFGEIIPEGDEAAGQIADNSIEVLIDSPSQVADFGRSGPFSGRSVIVAPARKCADQPDGKCA